MKKFILCLLLVILCLSVSVLLVSCDGGNHSDIGGTNVQEEGIDEGDIAKYVGDYIYILQSDGISVSKTLANGNVELISTYVHIGVTPNELYISNNRLIALYNYKRNENGYKRNWSGLRIFDLSDMSESFRFESKLLYSLNFRGIYRDSRIDIDKQRMLLCYGSNTSEFVEDYAGDFKYIDATLDYEINGEGSVVSEPQKLDNIPQGLESGDITTYGLIDLSNNDFELKLKATCGFPFQTFYVSEFGFYTAYSYTLTEVDGKGCGSEGKTRNHSMIARIDSETLEITAQKFFLGMDLISRHAVKDTGKNIYFALLDTINDAVVLISTDKELNVIGFVGDICQNETIESVSYANDSDKLYCMIVTYDKPKNLDPLFKIDVTDPENMFVTGLLSIDGYSSYTYNFDNYTVGIGSDGVGGVKISLFDTSNDIPVELKSFIKSDSVSEVTDNSKAFCVNIKNNIFAVPIVKKSANDVISSYMYFYQITESGELKELLFVENELYYNDINNEISERYFRRTFFSEHYCYIVSNGNIVSISLDDLLQEKVTIICDVSTRIKQ